MAITLTIGDSGKVRNCNFEDSDHSSLLSDLTINGSGEFTDSLWACGTATSSITIGANAIVDRSLIVVADSLVLSGAKSTIRDSVLSFAAAGDAELSGRGARIIDTQIATSQTSGTEAILLSGDDTSVIGLIAQIGTTQTTDIYDLIRVTGDDATVGPLTLTTDGARKWQFAVKIDAGARGTRLGNIAVDDENILSDGVVSDSGDDTIRSDPSFFNGTFVEPFTIVVTEAAGTVTMSLEKVGGGQLTMRLSDGHIQLDTDPALTIDLTTGSDVSPTTNYIYIPQSTKVLTKSTSGFPTAVEHIKVAFFLVPSATFVAANGVYVHQNWNDEDVGDSGQGHMADMTEWMRRMPAIWFSGLTGNGVDDYLTIVGATVDLKITSGVGYQLHRHSMPAFDTSVGDMVLVKNWSGDAYHEITNLYDIVDDSTGTTIGSNQYFNIVVWAVANETGTFTPTVINLPAGTYAIQADAENDALGYDDFAIPREFNIDSSTGLLICRLTVQKKVGTWEYKSTTDLRGQTPQTAAGGGLGGTTVTEFADNEFAVYDEADNTRILNLDLGIVTTGNTRTLVVPDADGTITLESHVHGGAAGPYVPIAGNVVMTGDLDFNLAGIGDAVNPATHLYVQDIYDESGQLVWDTSLHMLVQGAVVAYQGVGMGAAGDAQMYFTETADGWQMSLFNNADAETKRMEWNTSDHANAHDIMFYDGDGSTVSLLWDESDNRWEFATDVMVSGSVFTTASTQLGGFLVDSSGLTAGAGNYGSAINFSALAGFVKKAAIVPRQATSDSDSLGLDFLVSQSSIGADPVTLSLRLSSAGDIGFYKNDGTTISLLWDESDDRWELTTNLDMNHNILSSITALTSWNNDITIEAINSGAGSQDIFLYTDDSAGTQRLRYAIVGAGDLQFYKVDGSTISLLWDESDDRWEMNTDLLMSGDINLNSNNLLSVNFLGGSNAANLVIQSGSARDMDFKTDTGKLRFRIDKTSVGDIGFYKVDGSTVSLLWDESDNQWEMSTTLAMGGNINMAGNNVFNIGEFQGTTSTLLKIRAGTGQQLQIASDLGTLRFLVQPSPDDDFLFFKGDGSTVSLLWDESDDRWEMATALHMAGNVDLGGNQLTSVGTMSSYNTDLIVTPHGNDSTGHDLLLKDLDTGNAQRTRVVFDGSTGDIIFKTGDGVSNTLSWDESDDRWEFATQVLVDAGTVSLPGMAFASDVTTGPYSGGAGVYSLAAGATNIMDAAAAYTYWKSSGSFNWQIPDGVTVATLTSTQLLTPIGTAAAPGQAFLLDPNSGQYRHAVDVLGLASGGTTRMALDGVASTGGDIQFFKLDGSTVSLIWDESDDRWEFNTTVDMQGNQITNLINAQSFNTDLSLAAVNSGAAAQDLRLLADDSTGTQRLRILVDGDGNTVFYGRSGALSFLVDFNADINFSDNDLRSVGSLQSLDVDLRLFATNSGAASQDIVMYADDSGGVSRIRQVIDGADDIRFYKVDGTTVSLLWDESDNRWEFVSAVTVPAPTIDLHAATKKYVDDNVGGDPAWTELSSDTVLTASGQYLVDSSVGNRTITLPALSAVGADGMNIIVARDGAYLVYVKRAGSDTYWDSAIQRTLNDDAAVVSIFAGDTSTTWRERGYFRTVT